MVDLSKAKAGDTVVFRCGGTAVIEKITQNFDYSHTEPNEEIYAVTFVGADYTDYHRNGESVFLPNTFDIIEVIPAPIAFDWNKVKHGAAFMRAGSLLWFMGASINGLLVFDCGIDGVEAFSYEYANSHLTSAPEHDIKEGV